MTLEIKSGSLTDFFASAKATAQEIDAHKKITPKHTIWVDSNDITALLKPERTKLIQLLREEGKIVFSALSKKANRAPVSLNNDLALLSKYQLVRVFKEKNPGHGLHKTIEPLFGNEKIEFRVEI